MVAPNSARFDLLHLLRHDTHIGGVILAFVAEAIEFESIVKSRKWHNALLEADVGTTPTATAATSAMSTSMAHVMAAATTTHMMPASAAAVMTHVTTAAPVMTNVVTATLVLPTAMVFDVVSLVVMPVPMPIVPSRAAAPPKAGHPRTIAAYVPAGPLPTGVVPTIVTTIPDVLRALDQSQSVGRSAHPIRSANWRRLRATNHQHTAGHQYGGH
jgi:hypothetical protein